MLDSVDGSAIDSSSSTATLPNVIIAWRTTSMGLQVAVTPSDAGASDEWSSRVLDSISAWMFVNGFPSGVLALSDIAEPTCVGIDLADVGIIAAIEQEFKSRGMTIGSEGILQDAIAFSVRDVTSGGVLWSVWMNGRETVIAVRNHQAPFDSAGEFAILQGILTRAFGRAVEVIRR